MIFKLFRVYLLSFVLICFCILGVAQTIQDDVSAGKIPLPPDAQPLSGPRTNRSYGTSTNVIYTTNLDKNKLIRFYVKELSRRGWQSPQNLAQIFKQYNLPIKNRTVSGVNVDMARLLKNVIYFNKGSSKLMLMVVPPKGQYFTKTVFSLAYINAPASQGAAAYKPARLPNDVPIYPGAKMSSSTGNFYIYTTPDNIKTVAYFYQQKMSAYGWNLDSETPISKIQIKVPTGSLNAKGNSSCSSCHQESTAPPGLTEELKNGMYGLKQKSVFSKENGEECSILLIEVHPSSFRIFTQISIEYYGE